VRDTFSEKTSHSWLTSELKAARSFERPGEMDRPQIQLGRSDRWEDSARKPR